MMLLFARKIAVDELVQEYFANFSTPSSSPSVSVAANNEKNVLVTDCTGSLGGHLVYSLAQWANL